MLQLSAAGTVGGTLLSRGGPGLRGGRGSVPPGRPPLNWRPGLHFPPAARHRWSWALPRRLVVVAAAGLDVVVRGAGHLLLARFGPVGSA